MKLLNFCEFLCLNLLQWLLLIKRMHRLPRNMLQRSSIYFRCTNIRALNFGCTPLYLPLKSNNKTKCFFDFQASDLPCWLFVIDCNPRVSSSFVFQVVLFAAYARMATLTSGRNSTTHLNLQTVEQYLEKDYHFSLFVF